MTLLHANCLREYDIRGVVDETIDSDGARAIGRAFASEVKRRTGGASICVGYDGRLSSPDFERALVEGLVAAGADVRCVGLGPTPMLYYAGKIHAADGAIMVTGSHNPPNHNGFKMVVGGQPFFGRDIQDLGTRIAAGDFDEGDGRRRQVAVSEDYVARLVADYDGDRPLKVAWDAGSGAAGAVLGALTDLLPGEHVLLNDTVDGRFPAHHPDPTVAANLAQLIDTVRDTGCDLGIAFDGDGDRIGVVDGRGRILWGDQIMCLLAEDVLRDHPGATVIADVKASQVLFDHIAKAGGVPLMWRTGHSPIKQKMAETGAPLAGEMSGHIFFADRYYGYDDALYAAVRLIGAVARGGVSLADLRDRLPAVVNTPELRFPCPDERKFAVVEEVRGRLAEAGAEVNAIDGVRVATAEGWWLLRASNTQPVLVARCEAADAAGLETLKRLLAAQVRESGVEPPEM